MGLSKSKYTKFCQCPKALWLKSYKPDEEIIDPSVESRFLTGSQVGDLAKQLFGTYTEVTVKDEDNNLDLSAMIEKTKELTQQGVDNIAEAAFSHDGKYCAVDILHKENGGYAIYEVKSASGSETKDEKPTDIEQYINDIAYQKWVLTQVGVNVTGTYLVRLNSDYVRQGNLNIKKLFYIKNVDELVEQAYPAVGRNVAAAENVLSQTDEPVQNFGGYCNKPHKCTFWQYCSRNLPQHSIFDLYNLHFNKAVEHYYKGIVSIKDAGQLEKLTDIQQIQVSSESSGNAYINADGIRQFLKNITYPLYFLDFETMQDAVPQYDGTKPFQQITFQYSLHYIEKAGGELKHTEFLAEPTGDPRRALAEQLCKDIPMNVCTTVYNKSFECGRIKEMAEAFPDLAPHLLNIQEHIVDFLEPFRDGYYYLPAMNGSFSIKKVLPALFPDDPSLDYHNLTGGVQNGGEAMSIFPKMKDMTPSEQASTRKALLEYCKLDTYAMVKVWVKLCEAAEYKLNREY
ncbi:MAG: DUF2779 domain-containing protein [Paludibacteraceae bacterium]|nr:DUF2779 domain-containing protein [Paludibacteraceae bacterium]